MNVIVPIPRCPISVRVATAGDYTFIDRLQDMHSKALGFMPKAQLRGKIEAGHVLIAEDEMRLPVGYCMSQDRYFKRDDVGIIYQMNVVPGRQRSLVGATLVRAVFERAAYGCRLFCCWCAQDLDANYFWESLGFVPLAFRAGASGHGRRPQARTHIFWQRRVRERDTTTPYWFPAKTDGGHMREDRIVLPIPPGVHWRDEMPVLLPTAGVPEVQKALPEPLKNERTGAPAVSRLPKPQKVPTLMPPTRRGARFGLPSANAEAEPVATKAKPSKPKREKAGGVKADPAHVAVARELRDRWLERVNSGQVSGEGKYDVSRQLTDGATTIVKPMPLLGCDERSAALPLRAA
jgi:hypothetical protein